MIATLPMYDLPEARESTDRLWQAWAARLREAGVADLPGALERERWSEALLAPWSTITTSFCACAKPAAKTPAIPTVINFFIGIMPPASSLDPITKSHRAHRSTP